MNFYELFNHDTMWLFQWYAWEILRNYYLFYELFMSIWLNNFNIFRFSSVWLNEGAYSYYTHGQNWWGIISINHEILNDDQNLNRTESWTEWNLLFPENLDRMTCRMALFPPLVNSDICRLLNDSWMVCKEDGRGTWSGRYFL